MKKKTIIANILSFILLQVLYHVLLLSHKNIPYSPNKSLIFSLISLIALIWFARGLWKDTTESFLELMRSGNMQLFMSILSIIVWFMAGYKFYQDFHDTTFFEQNAVLVFVMAIIFAISIEIFFKVAYTKFIWLYDQLKKMKDEK